MKSEVFDDVLPVNVSNTVARVVEDYLTDLDGSVGGLVAGVYLTGSVALGDFHEAWSDIDFVTVLHDRPGTPQQTALADVHQRMTARHRRPRLDGYYLTWADLALAPDRETTLGLQAHDGLLHAGRNWVPSALVWHELHDHGLHVHGPDLATQEVAVDPEALRQWCLQQLDELWTPWWYRTARLLSASGIGSLGAWAPASGVLGVARAHYLLTTGRITSKCGAGEWALSICEPEWKRLLQECLRIRNRPDKPSLYANPLSRRRDALDFMDLLMTADENAFRQVATAS